MSSMFFVRIYLVHSTHSRYDSSKDNITALEARDKLLGIYIVLAMKATQTIRFIKLKLPRVDFTVSIALP